MNKQHRSIKFTFKTKQNNFFSFVDINLTHQNNQLNTSVYRKPTSQSDVFTQYGSYIDQSYKKSLIFNLLSCFILFAWIRHYFIRKFKNQDKLKKKKTHLSIWYYITINKNFLKQTLLSKTSIFNSPKKEATNNSTFSWYHIIKFKVKTANFYSKFITTM